MFSVTRRWLHQFNAIGIDGLGNRLDEDVRADNRHRPHRARNLRPSDHDDSITAPVADLAARIRRHKVLGGLIHEYEQAA